MNKMISICVPTLTKYDLLEKLIDSAKNSEIPVDRFFILDNGGTYNRPYIDISNLKNNDPKIKNYIDYNELVCVFRPGINLGVAGSWNWFIKNTPASRDDFYIMTNDDVEFYPNTLTNLLKNIENSWMILGAGGEFSLFAIRKKTIDKVGYFDDNFYPAYFEDNDYHFRMINCGIDFIVANDAEYKHVISATLKSYSPERTRKHHLEFQKNQNYFKSKWGRLP